MQIAEIRQLLQSLPISDTELIETHISWVILTGNFAYKVKRPVRFSFLDFTTLEQRHRYCLREVELNRRLTDDMYLGVVPVSQHGTQIFFGSSGDKTIDYAVQMRRIPQDCQMDIMLKKGLVTQQHIEQIAKRLSAFHISAQIPDHPPDIEVMLSDFADLGNYVDTLRSRYPASDAQHVYDAIAFAHSFLRANISRIQERYILGYVIDGHGDLHSKNIFLLDKPVIFDCLEFNDHLRYVDVLDELAFFCLDLQLFGRRDLATHFLRRYLTHYPCMLTDQDRRLFRYFQLYRAGVKLKINLIKATDLSPASDPGGRWENVDGYFTLFKQHLHQLKDVHASVYS